MKLMYVLIIDARYEERYYSRKPAESAMRDYAGEGIPCQLYLVDGEGYEQLIAVKE